MVVIFLACNCSLLLIWILCELDFFFVAFTEKTGDKLFPWLRKAQQLGLWAGLWGEAAWGWQNLTVPTARASALPLPTAAQPGGPGKQHGEDLERTRKCFPDARTVCNMVEVPKVQTSLPFISYPWS